MSTRILFITTGLESGGAEMSLYKTAAYFQRQGYECAVVSLTGEGPILGAKTRARRIALHVLGGRRGVPNPLLIAKIAQIVRSFQPDLVQTWLSHADLIGGLAARLVSKAPLIWSIHTANFDPVLTKRMTLLVVRINQVLSRWLPTKIACCSEAARAAHAAIGYDAGKLMVLPSGVDTDEFVPDNSARASVRQELGLPENTSLVGLMARFDPQKDHETFLRAAGLLRQARPDVHFVLCGAGITEGNAQLTAWAQQNGVADVTHLLGLRADGPRITAALDAATCCSRYGESFALVLGEAMACGVPVVTTDMAGPVSVVGDCGRVVPVGGAAALAEAWQEMLSLTANEREQQGKNARRRIVDTLSLERSAQGYETLYRSLLEAPVPSGTQRRSTQQGNGT